LKTLTSKLHKILVFYWHCISITHCLRAAASKQFPARLVTMIVCIRRKAALVQQSLVANISLTIVKREQHEIDTPEDAIKIHLLIHQLTVPVFTPILLYPYYAQQLIDERSVFVNVNEVYFPVLILKIRYCKNVGFMKYSHCFMFCMFL